MPLNRLRSETRGRGPGAGGSGRPGPGASMKSIGFVGLGAMGGPMARNLLKAGFRLRVHDLAAERVGPVAAAGAEARPSPREVARDADAVITMLPDSPDA